jgi:phage terminase small subunit
MTNKQQAFINEKIKGENNTQAAIKAGYSPKCAKEQGYENLTKPHIQEAIKEQEEELRAKFEWDINIAGNNLKAAYKLAKACKQPSAMVSAVIAANRMFGLDKDSSTDSGSKPLTPAQEARFSELARQETIRLAEGA